MTTKRIGFVDNALDNFHANVFLKVLRGTLRDRGFNVTGCLALQEERSRAWAEQNGVPWFTDPAELNRQVDYYMVLAPSNPEAHLALCEKVFPFGKPTYVDKTFAPDLRTAEAIFALADRHRVAVQTTSVLRYTTVQDYVNEVGREKARHLVAWGGGGSFGEYAIHPLELTISCLGPGARRLMRRGTGSQSQLLLDFEGDRTAVVNVYVNADTPFAASITTDAATRYLVVEQEPMWSRAMGAILDFYEAGRANIDRQESLRLRQILDAADDPQALAGFVELGVPTTGRGTR